MEEQELIALVDAAEPELWEQGEGFVGMCEHIARCASICYDSEPKKGGAAVDFVKMLIKKGHGRALEFGTISEMLYPSELNVKPKILFYGPYSRCANVDGSSQVAFAYNMRTAMDNGMTLEEMERVSEKPVKEQTVQTRRVTIHYPAISRAIADEFRTHTTLSTLMRSTRYVDSVKGGKMECVKPYWFDSMPSARRMDFVDVLERAVLCYRELIDHDGLQRQGARDILPLCVKTEMVQCGFTDSWGNFLRLRTDKAAHPDAQSMARLVGGLILDEVTKLNF